MEAVASNNFKKKVWDYKSNVCNNYSYQHSSAIAENYAALKYNWWVKKFVATIHKLRWITIIAMHCKDYAYDSFLTIKSLTLHFINKTTYTILLWIKFIGPLLTYSTDCFVLPLFSSAINRYLSAKHHGQIFFVTL